MTSEINTPPITQITEPVDYISHCPAEALVNIFKFLDPASLFVAETVCKRFKDIAKSDPVWFDLAKSVGVDLESSTQAQDRLFHRIKVIHSVVMEKFPNDGWLIVSRPNLLFGLTATLDGLIAKFTRGNEFNDAVNTHNIDVIRAVVKKGHLPNGNSIKLAIDSGKPSVIKEVLSHPCKPSKLSVSAAIASLNFEIMRMVLEHKPDVKDCSVNDAMRTEDLEIVRKLLDYGAIPDDQSVSIAFGEGKAFVKEILNHGGKPDDNSVNQAIQTRDLELLELVFSKGGKPNGESVKIAFATRNAEIIKNVLSHKAKPDNKGVNTAIEFGDLEILEMVFDNGGVPDDRSVSLALKKDDLDFVRRVLKGGGRPTQPSTKASNQRNTIIPGDMDSIITRSVFDVVVSETYSSYMRKHCDDELVKRAFLNGGKPSEFSIQLALQSECDELIEIVFEHAATFSGACNAAIKTKNPRYVRIVIDHGGKVDGESIDLALQTQDPEIIRMILAQGILPKKEHLSTAIGTNNPAIVKTILAHGVTPNEQSMSDAIKTKSPEVVEVLLDYGAEPSAMNLRQAVRTDKIMAKMLVAQILKVGLQFTVKPKEFDANDAIQAGDPEFLRQVLAHGAKLDGDSLSLAIGSRDPQIVKMVIDKGVGVRFFHFNEALETGDLDIVRLIFSKWSDFKHNVDRESYRIDLKKAVRTGNPAIVKIALESDAELTAMRRGVSSGQYSLILDAYSEVLKANNLEIIKMITLKLAKDGDHALLYVIEFNDTEVLQIYTSNYTKEIKYDFSHLDMAAKKGNQEIIKIIAAAVAKSNPDSLDKFLSYKDPEILQIFFDNGGKITPSSWALLSRALLATCGQPVLNKLAFYMAKSGENWLNALIDLGNREVLQVYAENRGDITPNFNAAAVAKSNPDNLEKYLAYQDPEILQIFFDNGGKITPSSWALLPRPLLASCDYPVLSKLAFYMAKSGENWLNALIDLGNRAVLQFYAENGGDITPNFNSLSNAIETRDPQIVKLVCSSGLVKPSFIDFKCATRNKNQEIISEVVVLLAKSGSDLLNEFIKYGDPKWLRLFVENGKPIVDEKSLGLAIKTKNAEVVKIVKEACAEKKERALDEPKVNTNKTVLPVAPSQTTQSSQNPTSTRSGPDRSSTPSVKQKLLEKLHRKK